MKKKIIFLLTAAVFMSHNMKAQDNNGASTMSTAIKNFLESGQLLTKETSWSHAMKEWRFKLTAEGETLMEPQALTQLEKAFAGCMSQSEFFYLSNTDKGSNEPWELQFHRQDNFYTNIYGHYPMEKDYNIRIMSIDETDGKTYYGVIWHVVPFIDSKGNSWRTLEGMLFRFGEGIWSIKTVNSNSLWQQQEKYYLQPLSDDDELKYEKLMAQMKRLNELAYSNKEIQTDLYLYMITKLFGEYKGVLTAQQYKYIIKQIYPFSYRETTAEQRRILEKYTKELSKHVRKMPTGTVWAFSNNISIWTNPENEKMLELQYDLGKDTLPQAEVKLTGETTSSVTVFPCFPSMHPIKVLPDIGRFTIREMLIKDQIFEVRDQQGNKIALFADSLPTMVNLEDMTVVGSPLNMRFAETQRQLKALERDLRKYVCYDADGEIIVMDNDGYERLLAEAHQLILKIIDENADTLIPAWYLANNFTAMSHYELSHRLRKDLPYASHIAVQPVWKYCEGLEKRQEGKMFTDAVCIDTNGVSHQLSEYIGKGDYVVLQFWEERNWTAHSGCKAMNQIAKDHRGKNIRVIGISLDTNKETWKQYIKDRKLIYEHLTNPSTDGIDRLEDDVVKAYGITSLPETIIFDPQGRIIKSGLAKERLKKYVNTLNLN
jgi:peroxiredoxin